MQLKTDEVHIKDPVQRMKTVDPLISDSGTLIYLVVIVYLIHKDYEEEWTQHCLFRVWPHGEELWLNLADMDRSFWAEIQWLEGS